MPKFGYQATVASCLAALLTASCSASSGKAPPVAVTSLRSKPQSEVKGGELLGRSTFQEQRSVPWLPFFNAPASGDAGVKNGAYCIHIDHLGKNQWDVQFRHRDMTIVNEHRYTVRFTAWSSSKVAIRAKVGMSGAPYTDYWAADYDLTSSPVEFSDQFTSYAPDDPSAEFAFHLSDDQAQIPVEICFDQLHLTDPMFVPSVATARARPPAIRVNQLGYFPTEKKRATWVIEGNDARNRAAVARAYELVDSEGTVLHHGTTEPFGRDATSNTYVQRIDFTAFERSAKSLRLRVIEVPGEPSTMVSDPFDVDPHLYQAINRDALRYFYYTRSGIALKQPYVENSIWERVEGHPTDKQVACAADAQCSYHLDVSGGWYDAGDYGKYVVNGGLSVWMLMNIWEMAQQKSFAVAGIKDKELNIPESGNGVPDLLDEARWELEWMLKMQVKNGDSQAGLVHHKLHDEDWSALGTLPVLADKTQRTLRPVSTAATLNLAATAAQANRVYAKIDPPFAARCLAAATRAWEAAEKNPALFITIADNHGGGAYEDADVSDERYWAATELYLSTHDARFLDAMTKSPHYLRVEAQATGPGLFQAIDWRTTAALGNLSIALDNHAASKQARDRNKAAILAVADRYLALTQADGFGQPYTGTHYTWGSNSFMLNNGIILAYAHAISNEHRYLEGAIAALDYILGRNALGQSYVSGYGERPLTNPHHRMWAHAVAPKFPPPPPGVVSGGPNSELQDPYSKAANLGCIGQTCYVDHVDAYSANEVAINWNAELAWLVAYLNATLSQSR
ncbi:MAG TPA: glycoside hydrolase family 9 protein [Polyangiaceae bacterium]